VVILPGLGNNSKDYDRLVGQLQQRGLHVEVAAVRRPDWARNAAGLVYPDYWRGTLTPRPTVDWYLNRVGAAVEAAKRATDGAPLTLLCHSAGGWLGRCARPSLFACLHAAWALVCSTAGPAAALQQQQQQQRAVRNSRLPINRVCLLLGASACLPSPLQAPHARI
jgi:alpha-beta hydrolase superfamily lysophospholipase